MIKCQLKLNYSILNRKYSKYKLKKKENKNYISKYIKILNNLCYKNK